jgi:SAM-dependent methyltransferase
MQSFLFEHMAKELAERLALLSRSFERALLIGPITGFAELIFAGTATTVIAEPLADEEALPYEHASFDLILSAGTLDSVNDLPGALVQIRRCLKPDGLFLGTLFGAGSLQALKSAMIEADGAQATAHIHPQIDMRAASDLLTRAGFALPVADLDRLDVRYRYWQNLVADLRAAGVGNAMAGERRFPGRDSVVRLDAAWAKLAQGGERVPEALNFIHLSGWAPAASQPKPARRGSGQVSLADILPRPDGID